MYRVEEPISLSFTFRPRCNIGTDKSAAQSGATLRHMHSRYLPNSNSLICGASHREAVSTIFKVFGMTRPRMGQNPRPPELIADTLPIHYRVGFISSLLYEGEMEEYRAKLRQARNENLRLINFNYHVTRNTGRLHLLTYIFDSDLVCN